MIHPTDALRLVPVEPTEKMLAQGKYAYAMTHEDDALRGAWAVMLSAAPASPLPEGGGQCSGITGELSGWQDISTAPKDGTEVLIWATYYPPGHPVTARWDFDTYSKTPIPRWVSRDPIYGRRAFIDRPATHWMPLPAAPTGDAK